ncbi:MAG: hypothetical protein P8Z36_03100 [Gemmatimonadota bacterium]
MHLRKPIILALAMVAGWSVARPARAQEQDTTRIPTGVQLGLVYETSYRPSLAVRPFSTTDSTGLADVADQVFTIVRRDLDYSDRFDMHFDIPPALAQGPVDYGAWNDLNVVYLLTGGLEPAEGGGTVMRLTLHDVVYSTIKEMSSFHLPAVGDPGFRMAVHAASDQVVRWATGSPGIAASRILFTVQNPKDRTSREILIVDSDGENLQPVVTSQTEVQSPAWSPDGAHMAFTERAPDGWRLEERDMRTGRIRMIGAQSTLYLTPTYSPDGTHLVFGMWQGGNSDLYEYDISRYCCMRQLTHSTRVDMYPSFSPDGKQLAFMSDRLGPPGIFIMPADGGEPTALSPFVYGEPGFYTSPDWSPTNSYVAFHGRSIGGRFQIMVADASRPGETVQQLTSGGRNEDPSWGPDGRHLVFSGMRGTGVGLYVIDSVTGRIRPLVLGRRYRVPAWSGSLLQASALTVRAP